MSALKFAFIGLLVLGLIGIVIYYFISASSTSTTSSSVTASEASSTLQSTPTAGTTVPNCTMYPGNNGTVTGTSYCNGNPNFPNLNKTCQSGVDNLGNAVPCGTLPNTLSNYIVGKSTYSYCCT